jgi:hypothetical protein
VAEDPARTDGARDRARLAPPPRGCLGRSARQVRQHVKDGGARRRAGNEQPPRSPGRTLFRGPLPPGPPLTSEDGPGLPGPPNPGTLLSGRSNLE